MSITTTPAPSLLGGACNYIDLNGANGQKCGCRRFWSRATSARFSAGSPTGYSQAFPPGDASPSADSVAFCMCSHHACYHDDIREAPASIATTTNAVGFPNTGQENERPRANREPLTPVLPELSFPPASLQPGQPTEFNMYNNQTTSFSTHVVGDVNIPQGEVAASAREQQSVPDTLSWTNFIQSPSDQGHKMPPIPSQCLIPSQPSSTTSSVRMAYLKPFAGKGLQTLSGVKSKLREPLIEEDEETIPVDEQTREPGDDQSVDDLATVANTPRSARTTDAIQRNTQATPSRADRDTFQELSSTVQGHEQRLDRLENVSFSAAGHDECHDKHDQADLRVTEVEYRVTELEKLLNDSSSTVGTSRRPRVDDSASTVASVSTDQSELYSELQSLKAQLSQLQGISSFTSYSNPWHIEVVYLPFPLKGVWCETGKFSSQRAPSASLADSDPWTQMPNSSSSIDPQSPGFCEWTGPEFESDWLLPRACAPDRMIDRRLRSRGLVKQVTVRGPDARSVQQAVSEAFGTLFRTFSRMQGNVYHGSTTHHRVHKFLGLQHPWVPLRKQHKDSRLRFLSPAEMVTPVAWDVQFLSSSVVMKATGVQRLFITQPEAYLQDQDAYDNGWSWQRLRELSRIYPDSQNSQEVPEADAMEDCWQWNDRLDDSPASANSSQSLSMRQGPRARLRTTPFSPAPQAPAGYVSIHGQSLRSNSPRIVGGVESRKASRPPRIRTTSMPPNLPVVASPAQASSRRITTYVPARERHSSPQVNRPVSATAHAMAMNKRARRRSTRSPAVFPLPRHITPRRSTASPSPVPEVIMRGTTPYYATPYSNAPIVDTRPNRACVVIYDDGAGFEDEGRGTDTDPFGDELDVDFDDVEGFDDQSEDEYQDSPMLDLAQQHNAQILSAQQHSSAMQSGESSWQDGRPEDEPWPGIEDAENRDPTTTTAAAMPSSSFNQTQDFGLRSSGAFDDFDIDIHVDEDAMSDADADVDADDDNDDRGEGRDGPGRRSRAPSSAPSEYPSTQRAWTAVTGEDIFKVFEDPGPSTSR